MNGFYLFKFGFQGPGQLKESLEHADDFGFDDGESSMAIWIEADTAEAALAWGIELADVFVREFFIQQGWTKDIPSWKEAPYAHWIESDESVADGENLPRARWGETPDFGPWL